MRTPSLIHASICGTVSLIVGAIGHADPSVTVSNTPLPVQVTNTSIPVSGTVGLSGPVNATLTGTPTVSATITNSSSNPIPVTVSNRPPVARLSADVFPGQRINFPTGFTRLVIESVSYQITTTNPSGVTPEFFVNDTTGNFTLARGFLPVPAASAATAQLSVIQNSIPIKLIIDQPSQDFVAMVLITASVGPSGGPNAQDTFIVEFDGHFEPQAHYEPSARV